MVDGLVGERTLRERYWRDQRMARAGREALALAALPTRRAAARLLELAAERWANPQGHPTTDADRYAAWTSRGDASATDDPALRLATAWLRLPGVPDRAHRALTEVFGDDPEAAAAALATAWSLLDPTPGILWQVDDAHQARDAVWLLEAGHPWPGPTALGMDRAVLDALRSQAPRAADRLAILHLTPAPADGLAAAPVLAAPESVAPEPEATASTAPESEAPSAPADAVLESLRTTAREALRTTREARDPLREGAARSAAEAFLAAVLARRPRTAGRFVLNGQPGFTFGPGPCHVDLLARAPRLALEIDGPHHFLDDEAFRRDRRKDLLLQRHGYAVLRVLAADVVERLEEVLRIVDETLDWRETQES